MNHLSFKRCSFRSHGPIEICKYQMPRNLLSENNHETENTVFLRDFHTILPEPYFCYSNMSFQCLTYPYTQGSRESTRPHGPTNCIPTYLPQASVTIVFHSGGNSSQVCRISSLYNPIVGRNDDNSPDIRLHEPELT